MKQVLIVYDRRFVPKEAIDAMAPDLFKNGIQAYFIRVGMQIRPIEVYSFDNLPEATMEVFRKFIESEAVVTVEQ